MFLGLRGKRGFWSCFSLPSLYLVYAVISFVTVRSFGWGAETNEVVAALYVTGWWAVLAFHSAAMVSLAGLSCLMYWLIVRPGPATPARRVVIVVFSVIFGAMSFPVLSSYQKLVFLFFPDLFQYFYAAFSLVVSITVGIPVVLCAILATYLSMVVPREAERPSERPLIDRPDRKLALTLYSVVVTSALLATVIYSWQSLGSMELQLLEIAIDRNKLVAYNFLMEPFTRTTYICPDKVVYSLGEPVNITLVTEFGIDVENLSLRVGDHSGSILVAVFHGAAAEGLIPYQEPWSPWSPMVWEVSTETLIGADVTLFLCNHSDHVIGPVVETYAATVGETVLNISAKSGQRLAMSFTWDQTDFEGRQVQPGAYMLQGRLESGWKRAHYNIFITQP